jgi:hypothetical protein
MVRHKAAAEIEVGEMIKIVSTLQFRQKFEIKFYLKFNLSQDLTRHSRDTSC